MEKFLFTFKLSKGSIIIGWFKFILNILIALGLIIGVIMSASFVKSLEEIFGDSDGGSIAKFYAIFVLIVLFVITYGVFSFVLIIGSINHDRMKVLSFLIVDGVYTLLMLFALYHTWLSISVVCALIVQVYLLCSVFYYWKTLHKEHKDRMENREARSRWEQVETLPR